MGHARRDKEQLDALTTIFQETSRHVGEEFLKALVRGLGQLLDAETTFVAHILDDPPSRVRGIAAWKDGNFRDSWEYNLAGNPCLLTYSGNPTFIPCELAKTFPNKKDSGYDNYIGIPLSAPDGKVIGHIAIYASKPHPEGDFALEIARLCGYRAEAEVLRLMEDEVSRQEIDQLSEGGQRKTEALQVVNHELRTPLSSVIGFLKLIDQQPLDEPAKGYVNMALEGADRLLHMINQQLDLAKIEQGEIAREDRVVDIIETARGCIDRLAPLAQPWRIDLVVDTKLDSALVNGDEGHLGRLLDNLVSNAMKISPEGSTVRIEIVESPEETEDGGYWRVSVHDQGPGIPDDLTDTIFEKFSRGATITDRQRGGAGLGLSIARAIVMNHDGMIDFTTAAGQGTAFYFDLPVGQPP